MLLAVAPVAGIARVVAAARHSPVRSGTTSNPRSRDSEQSGSAARRIVSRCSGDESEGAMGIGVGSMVDGDLSRYLRDPGRRHDPRLLHPVHVRCPTRLNSGPSSVGDAAADRSLLLAEQLRAGAAPHPGHICALGHRHEGTGVSVVVAVQIATIWVVLRASEARRRLRVFVSLLAVLSAIVATVNLFLPEQVDDNGFMAVVSALLYLGAPSPSCVTWCRVEPWTGRRSSARSPPIS